MSVTITPDTPPRDALSAPGERGNLNITERAVRRLCEEVIARTTSTLREPRVQVRSLTDDGVEIEATVVLDYPTEPLSPLLADLRQRIVSETSRQLGRPLRHFNIIVSDFTLTAEKPARRVV